MMGMDRLCSKHEKWNWKSAMKLKKRRPRNNQQKEKWIVQKKKKIVRAHICWDGKPVYINNSNQIIQSFGTFNFVCFSTQDFACAELNGENEI